MCTIIIIILILSLRVIIIIMIVIGRRAPLCVCIQGNVISHGIRALYFAASKKGTFALHFAPNRWNFPDEPSS